VRPEIPKAIGAAVLKALARKPEDRYASADLFARDLRKAAAMSDVDLAPTAEIVAFVQERAATSVDRLSRSIRETATPSTSGSVAAVGVGSVDEEPTTLDPILPLAVGANASSPAPAATRANIASARSSLDALPFWRRWWRGFLRWLGLSA